MTLLAILLVETVLLAALAVAFIFLGLPLVFKGAPFVPSFRKRRREILEPLFELALKAPGRKFVDIGSGDGRVVIEFARQDFEATGVELNPFLVWYSRRLIKRAKLKNAQIIKTNFYNFDPGEFDVIYVFQLNSVNALLAEKFKRELKPGAVIISAGFILPGFELLTKSGPFWVYRN